MKKLLFSSAGVLFSLALSGVAATCPVCFAAANDENRFAFIAMTAFLTLLPLGLIGFGVWWYKKRLQEFDKRARAARRAARRRRRPALRRPALGGQVFTAPQGYFERGYAGTPKVR